MNKILIHAVAGLVFAGVSVGCAPEVLPVAPTHAPLALPTLIPPTQIPFTPTATATPTLPPTATLAPTATNTSAVTQEPGSQAPPVVLLPTASPTPAASPTPLPSPTHAPSPTPAAPGGVYVTDLRIDPPPERGPELKFYPTFLNTLEEEQNYRWAVYIFRADNQRRTGETTRTDMTVPTGTSELESVGSWKLPLGGPCEYLYAQVGWAGADNQITWFTAPNGPVFQKGFAPCPP